MVAMIKAYYDGQVVLDVILKRQPFYDKSITVFQCIDQRLINGCLSSSAMTDIFRITVPCLRVSEGLKWSHVKGLSGQLCIQPPI